MQYMCVGTYPAKYLPRYVYDRYMTPFHHLKDIYGLILYASILRSFKNLAA